eukprot:14410075-Alexandrium_andersonii.AAC.1
MRVCASLTPSSCKICHSSWTWRACAVSSPRRHSLDMHGLIGVYACRPLVLKYLMLYEWAGRREGIRSVHGRAKDRTGRPVGRR